VSGRAALANDLSSTFGVANLALNTMGRLGGPVASLAISGLKAAMTAHNFTALTEAFANLSPSQRAALTTEEAFALSNPPAIGQFFGMQGIADPLGQKESLAFQSQRQGERAPAVTPNAPEGTIDAPQDTSTAGPAGGGPAGVGSSGVSASEGQYSKGGFVKDRVPGRGDNEPALLAGGEFVIRREVVKRHRRLLERINRGR